MAGSRKTLTYSKKATYLKGIHHFPNELSTVRKAKANARALSVDINQLLKQMKRKRINVGTYFDELEDAYANLLNNLEAVNKLFVLKSEQSFRYNSSIDRLIPKIKAMIALLESEDDIKDKIEELAILEMEALQDTR